MPLASRRSQIAFGATVALLAALFVFLNVVRIVEPLGVDQGLFACFTRWVPHGWLPYRDIFDSKPPLFLYTYALAAAIPGDVVRAIWWLEAAWLAATLGVGYLLGARLGGRWAGLATASLLFIGLWSPAWGGFWSRAQSEEMLALPMLGSAWLAWRAMDRAPLALWAGVLAGVCGLYKIPSMAIAGAWALTWLMRASPGVGTSTASTSRRAHYLGAARRIALLGTGIAAPWALAVAWFAAHGALPSFVDGVFVYHRYNAAYIAPPWADVARDFSVTMVLQGSLLLVAAAIGIVTMRRGRAREVIWVGSWIAMTLAAIVLQRQLAGYHYLLAIPALAVAGGVGLVDAVRGAIDAKESARTAHVIALAAMIALGGREMATWYKGYSLDADCLRGRITREEYLRRIQQGNYSLITEAAAATYLDTHTSKADGILVWGLSPGIYALADRHPTTRFPFHKLLMTDAPLSRMWPGLEARRAQFMAGLSADPPAYILVGRGDRNGFEPEDSLTSMMRFGPFQDLILREYAKETQIGHFLVFRRGRSRANEAP